MTSAASTAVFDITELLEHILTYLSTSRILQAQAVCKQFRAVTDGSIRMQYSLLRAIAPYVKPTLWFVQY